MHPERPSLIIDAWRINISFDTKGKGDYLAFLNCNSKFMRRPTIRIQVKYLQFTAVGSFSNMTRAIKRQMEFEKWENEFSWCHYDFFFQNLRKASQNKVTEEGKHSFKEKFPKVRSVVYRPSQGKIAPN